MTSTEQGRSDPVQLPVAPGNTRQAVLAELERLTALVRSIRLEDWGKRSATREWTIGDVVAHLNLGMGLYSRLLEAVTAGKGQGSLWKAVAQMSKTVAPMAAPAFSAINREVPRIIDRTLSPEVIKGQFEAGARKLRERVTKVEPGDYTRPVYYMGGTWPLSFFLAAVLNELALHGWDIDTVLDPQATLSDEARSILPWFYWSGTPLMFHVPKDWRGTVQVVLTDPSAEMWWSVNGTDIQQGVGQTGNADVTITGGSGAFLLTLSGRMTVDDALRTTSLSLNGNVAVGTTFLSAWRLI